MKTLRERIESKIERIPIAGCWIWTGALFNHKDKRHRRPQLRMPARCEQATRLSWQVYRGEIPKGLEVCHRCDVGLCVNPTHLFLGTHRENMQDCIRKGRFVYPPLKKPTHCKRGHEFTAANTTINTAGSRQCLACRRLVYRERKRRARPDN